MKHLLLFLFMALAFQTKAANDTLTRAQVYNFNVGDTFEYKIESKAGTLNGNDGITYDLISFQRIIITQAHSFPAQDSIFVAEAIYHTPAQTQPGDTFSFQNNNNLMLDSCSVKYAISDPTVNCGYNLCSLTIDTAYNQRIVDQEMGCGGLGCYTDNVAYASGLGITGIYTYSSDGFSSWNSGLTTLIYFHKATEIWGTPETIVMGTNDIAANSALINLFPTINTGQFQIKITNGNSPNYQLLVYDLTGRVVEHATLKNGINDVTLSSSNKGMYLWSVMSDGVILKAGKLVVQ